jgi:putative component of toxin-antitoxin plasmid stabilization module
MFQKRLVLRGEKFSIYAIVENGKDRFKEFYDHLTHTNIDAKGRLDYRIEHISKDGPPRNPEHFRSVGDGVYEIKISLSKGAYRVFCLLDGKFVYLILGADKPSRKEQGALIKRAKKIKEDFHRAMKG